MNKPIIAQMENGGGLIEAPEPDFKTLLDADLERIMPEPMPECAPLGRSAPGVTLLGHSGEFRFGAGRKS